MPVEPGLLARLRAAGPVNVATLFDLAVAADVDGYYQRAPTAVFGRDGDFVTAPEVSQVFGELVGLALADTWQRSGAPAPAVFAELGPGRGTLLADLWRAVGRIPGLEAAWAVHLVERSRSLRAAQAAAVPDLPATWHASVEDLPTDRPLFLVANEFLDALPIRQFERTAAGWAERFVVVDEGGHARWQLRPASMADARFAHAPVGAVAETSPARVAVAATVARTVAARGGLGLLVDYGGVAVAARDTLQAVRRHRPVDVLDQLGWADLSSAVDFRPLAEAAAAAGAAVYGPLPQARVLRALGVELRALRLAQGRDDAARRTLFAGIRRLLDPRAMGEAFKILAVAHPAGPVPAGFDEGDRW